MPIYPLIPHELKSILAPTRIWVGKLIAHSPGSTSSQTRQVPVSVIDSSIVALVVSPLYRLKYVMEHEEARGQDTYRGRNTFINWQRICLAYYLHPHPLEYHLPPFCLSLPIDYIIFPLPLPPFLFPNITSLTLFHPLLESKVENFSTASLVTTLS